MQHGDQRTTKRISGLAPTTEAHNHQICHLHPNYTMRCDKGGSFFGFDSEIKNPLLSHVEYDSQALPMAVPVDLLAEFQEIIRTSKIVASSKRILDCLEKEQLIRGGMASRQMSLMFRLNVHLPKDVRPEHGGMCRQYLLGTEPDRGACSILGEVGVPIDRRT
ncbi:hypothetical protein R1flu_006662 [Riccia fluitans]|uniref:Uncharacterized protein n=1 Tax=Riccia fluitans TaxID=41844 RepID=A0ABD1YXD7_9MARC